MELVGLSKEIFESRYMYPGEKTYADRAKAQAKHMASVEADDKKELWHNKFYDAIRVGDFLPGGRIAYGAGRTNQNLLNCYQISPEDNVESIGKCISDMYRISCGGGGVGFNFSKIRPLGDDIGNMKWSAPGSVSNMQMINKIGDHVRSGGNRRTALIAVLEVTHPDLPWFLDVKLDKGELTNFNISVGITDAFIAAVEAGDEWYFTFGNRIYNLYRVTTEDGKETQITGVSEEDAIGRANQFRKDSYTQVYIEATKIVVTAREIWDRIYSSSIASGCPGIYNVDFANRYTNVSYFESLPAPNPCGEIPLPNYGNCCLGHINLNNMVKVGPDGKLEPDYSRIAKTARVGVRFLDNVLTANHYPIPECRTVGERSRRIGLGVTGLHYFLIKLGYKYGDETCCEFLERLFQTIRDESYKASISISREKGAFPAFDARQYLAEDFAKTLPPRIRTNIKKYGIRNAVMLTAAPVGTGSMVLGVSTGIEPMFSPIYERKYREGNVWKKQLVVDPLFKDYFLRGKNLDTFVGAYDVTPEEHIRVQASIQKFVDNALSKTLNLPEDATYEDLKDIILDYAPYVKGFTIYRAGSKGDEPLVAVSIVDKSKDEIKAIMADAVGYGQEEHEAQMPEESG